jgi:phosphate starvation-inducible PhoH-like protein
MKRVFFSLWILTLFNANYSFMDNRAMRVCKTTQLAMRGKKNMGEMDSINGKFMTPKYTPKTENQKKYLTLLKNVDKKIVIGAGVAGTGKTLFACYEAITQLKKGAVNKIIMTRPVVSVEEDIGFLPGSILHKMDPWTRPIFDILLEFYSQKDIDSMIHGGTIEISPIGFMRGRTFKKAFIIADEMQNSSPNQMLMLITRIGDNSKMVITGDVNQSDRGESNGLVDLLSKIKTSSAEYSNRIGYVEFNETDVQRSPIVADILNMYSGRSVVRNGVIDSVRDWSFNSSMNNGATNRSSNSSAMADAVVAENRIKIQAAIAKMMKDYKRNDDAAMIPASDISKNYKT